MKIRFALLLLCIINSLLYCLSADKQIVGSYSQLEQLIDSQPQFICCYIDSLNNIDRTDKSDYEFNRMMYDAYSAFCYDSAYNYISKNIQMMESLSQREQLQTQLDLLHILSVAGLFSEARQTLDALVSKENVILTVGQDMYVRYLCYACDLYLYMAEFADEPYRGVYMSKVIAYRKLIVLSAMAGTYEYVFAQATLLAEDGQYEQAIMMLEELLIRYESGNRQYSIIAGTLGFFYHYLNDIESQKYYFILSAQSDIRGCIRENNSLRALAELLYSEGNIAKAYKYLYVSIQDAQFYGSRLRTFQTGQVTPIIVQAWQAEQARNRRLVFAIFLLFSLFIIVLVVTVTTIAISLRRVRKAHIQVENKNAEISAINSQLYRQNEQIKESNKVKLEYVSGFMHLASDYIKEFEQTRVRLNRLMMDGKQQEAAKLLQSNSLANKNIALFHKSFDNAFLNIYPNFIDSVNALLQDDEKIVPKDGEQFTTELRILALLRLGISDNQEISDILRSSITTVYTYRSRLRSRAFSPATFEQDILKIDAYLEE